MKHLKKFNESHSDKVQEIRQFCEEALIELIDKGYSIDISKLHNSIKVSLVKNNKSFYWVDIKDKVIPFLEILIDNYELITANEYTDGNISLINIDYSSNSLTYDQLIDYEDYYDSNILKGIRVYIKL